MGVLIDPGASATGPDRARRTRWLAVWPAIFFAAHAVFRIGRGEPEALLWCCNAANALMVVGLALASGPVTATAFLWLLIGEVAWGIDLKDGLEGGFVPTQLLTHVGGIVVGGLGLWRLGMPRGTWWKAYLSFVALQQVSRVVSTPEQNINCSHGVYAGWREWVPSYALYWVVCSAGLCAVFYAVERTLGWARRPTPGPAP